MLSPQSRVSAQKQALVLFSEFSVPALAAGGPVLVVSHDKAGSAAGAVFLCGSDLGAFYLEVCPSLGPFCDCCLLCCRHDYAAPSSLGLGMPRAARCGRSVLFLLSSLS